MIKAKMPLLKTGRLTLHGFLHSDLDNTLDLICNEEIKRTYLLPDFPSKEDAAGLFQALMDMSNSEERFVYGIYLQDSLIGFLNQVEADGSSIEVGYVIHPRWQNRGYCTEALAASIRELFRMGYSSVRAGFFQENPASGRVMEKCGMKRIEFTEEIPYRGAIHHCIYYEIRN